MHFYVITIVATTRPQQPDPVRREEQHIHHSALHTRIPFRRSRTVSIVSPWRLYRRSSAPAQGLGLLGIAKKPGTRLLLYCSNTPNVTRLFGSRTRTNLSGTLVQFRLPVDRSRAESAMYRRDEPPALPEARGTGKRRRKSSCVQRRQMLGAVAWTLALASLLASGLGELMFVAFVTRTETFPKSSTKVCQI